MSDVISLDANSLYPYASMNIEFPKLNTEMYIKGPTRTMKVGHVIERCGISRAIVENKGNKIGLLPVRINDETYYPRKGIMIGTWTNYELRKCVKEGYKIHDIDWTINYETIKNPFKEITPKLYRQKKEANNDFDYWFYKMMMNASYGKLAQTRTGQKIIIDSVEEYHKMIENGYNTTKIVTGKQ